MQKNDKVSFSPFHHRALTQPEIGIPRAVCRCYITAAGWRLTTTMAWKLSTAAGRAGGDLALKPYKTASLQKHHNTA